MQIVNMSAEDLLTPELRAMADSIRARSLKESVKLVAEAPRIRRTHKGEEVVDEFATTDTSVKVDATDSPLRASTSTFPGDAQSPRLPQQESGRRSPSISVPPADSVSQSPVQRHERRASSGRPRMLSTTTSFVVNAVDLGLEDGSNRNPPNELTTEPLSLSTLSQGDEEMNGSLGMVDRSESPSTSKSKFDFASIWGSFKAPTTPKIDQTDGTNVDMPEGREVKPGEDYDPFDLKPSNNSDEEVDMELDELLNADPTTAPTVSTTPPGSPPPQAPTISSLEFIKTFAPVWAGEVSMPDEGGYPCVAVQIGGRALGAAEEVWRGILPPWMGESPRKQRRITSINVLLPRLVNWCSLVFCRMCQGQVHCYPERRQAK